ncbi:MAG: putative integral rane protein [Frankiales bacterium]|nr:putative integral rane protein [Frankiales bacterium]
MSETPASGKGRPTPKRKDSQRRRGGPVAPPPATRKEAAKRIRQEGADKRKAIKAGTRSGDERAMLGRDQGPVRRLVRDLVDSRRHIGVFLLPATVLPLIADLSSSRQVRALAVSIWLTAVLLTVFDMIIMGVLVRRRVRAEFPGETKTRGHVVYGVVRTAQFRRFRLPPPRVSPGDPV